MRSLSASSHRTRAGTRSSEATTRRGLAGELHIPAREPPVPIVVGRHCVRIADRDAAEGIRLGYVVRAERRLVDGGGRKSESREDHRVARTARKAREELQPVCATIAVEVRLRRGEEVPEERCFGRRDDGRWGWGRK